MAAEIRTEPEDEVLDLTSFDLHGLHVEEQEPHDLDDELPRDLDGPLSDLIDAFAEAYNAHDLDRALELLTTDAELPGLGGDVAGFVPAIERRWDDRPTAVLARGQLGDQPVALLWDAVDDRGWCRVALMTFDLDGTADALGLIEVIEGDSLIDEAEAEAPESEFVEGSRWEEWDEGAG